MEEKSRILQECLTYFRNNSVFEKLFQKIRRKYESLGRFGGSVVLEKLSLEEKEKIGGFFGKDYRKQKTITVSIESFEKAPIENLISVLTSKPKKVIYLGEVSQMKASMIVYENGRPKRNDYRKFKIKGVQGPDDYACMEEVLKRRFTHGLQEQENEELGSFSKFPDLIMMDGGKGQVNVAVKVLLELGLDIPVCGMVKDDKHRTRGLYFENKELPIKRECESFKLITRIQDEAHRFAITFHRDLRNKNQVHSVLNDIDGIGPARRRALMKELKTLDAIKDASVEELKKIPAMNETAAQKVYDFFH